MNYISINIIIRSYLANDAESLQFEIEDNHSSLGTISIKSSDMEHQLLKQNVQLSTATNEIESHQKVTIRCLSIY